MFVTYCLSSHKHILTLLFLFIDFKESFVDVSADLVAKEGDETAYSCKPSGACYHDCGWRCHNILGLPNCSKCCKVHNRGGCIPCMEGGKPCFTKGINVLGLSPCSKCCFGHDYSGCKYKS